MQEKLEKYNARALFRSTLMSMIILTILHECTCFMKRLQYHIYTVFATERLFLCNYVQTVKVQVSFRIRVAEQ